jgi:dihydrofolate reductase
MYIYALSVAPILYLFYLENSMSLLSTTKLLVSSASLSQIDYKCINPVNKMFVYLIAAVSENDVIGLNGQLPWRLPLDLKWFKMNTNAGTVIMGRKTWDSLPKKPLPNRLNIVISRQPRPSHGNTIWCTSLAEALSEARGQRIYIIGGEDIFRIAMRHVHILLLTRVQCRVEGKHLKYLTIPKRKTLVWSSKPQKHKELQFHFEIYLNH